VDNEREALDGSGLR